MIIESLLLAFTARLTVWGLSHDLRNSCIAGGNHADYLDLPLEGGDELRCPNCCEPLVGLARAVLHTENYGDLYRLVTLPDHGREPSLTPDPVDQYDVPPTSTWHVDSKDSEP